MPRHSNSFGIFKRLEAGSRFLGLLFSIIGFFPLYGAAKMQQGLQAEISSLAGISGANYVKLRNEILLKHRDSLPLLADNAEAIPNRISILKLRLRNPEASERVFKILAGDSKEHWNPIMRNPRPTRERTVNYLNKNFGTEFLPIVEEFLFHWANVSETGGEADAAEIWYSQSYPEKSEKVFTGALLQPGLSQGWQALLVSCLTRMNSKKATLLVRDLYDKTEHEYLKMHCLYYLAKNKESKIRFEIESQLKDTALSENRLRELLNAYGYFIELGYYESQIEMYRKLPNPKARKHLLDGVSINPDNVEGWKSNCKSERDPELKSRLDSLIAEHEMRLQEIRKTTDEER